MTKSQYVIYNKNIENVEQKVLSDLLLTISHFRSINIYKITNDYWSFKYCNIVTYIKIKSA